MLKHFSKILREAQNFEFTLSRSIRTVVRPFVTLGLPFDFDFSSFSLVECNVSTWIFNFFNVGTGSKERQN